MATKFYDWTFWPSGTVGTWYSHFPGTTNSRTLGYLYPSDMPDFPDMVGSEIVYLKVLSGQVRRGIGGDDSIQMRYTINCRNESDSLVSSGRTSSTPPSSGAQGHYTTLPQDGTQTIRDIAQGEGSYMAFPWITTPRKTSKFRDVQTGAGVTFAAQQVYSNNMGGDDDFAEHGEYVIRVGYIPNKSTLTGSGIFVPQNYNAVSGNALVNPPDIYSLSADLEAGPTVLEGTGRRFLVRTGSGALQGEYPITERNYFKKGPVYWDTPFNGDTAPIPGPPPNSADPDKLFVAWDQYDGVSEQTVTQFRWTNRTPTVFVNSQVDPDGYVDIQYKTTLRTRVSQYSDKIRFGFLRMFQSAPYLNCYEPDWNYFKFHLKDANGTILTTFWETGPLWAWALANGAAASPLSTYVAEGFIWAFGDYANNVDDARTEITIEIDRPDLSLYPTAEYIDWEINVGNRAVTAQKLNGFDYYAPRCDLQMVAPFLGYRYQGPVLGYDLGWALGNIADHIAFGQLEASEQMGYFVVDKKDYFLHRKANPSTKGEMLPYRSHTGPEADGWDYPETGFGWFDAGEVCVFDTEWFGDRAYKWRWATDGVGNTENFGWNESLSGVKGEPWSYDEARSETNGITQYRVEFYANTRSGTSIDDSSRPQVYIDLPVTEEIGDGNFSPGDQIMVDWRWDVNKFQSSLDGKLYITPKAWVLDGYGGNEIALIKDGPEFRHDHPLDGCLIEENGVYKVNTKNHGVIPEGATWIRIAQEATLKAYTPSLGNPQIQFLIRWNEAYNTPYDPPGSEIGIGEFEYNDGVTGFMPNPKWPSRPGDPYYTAVPSTNRGFNVQHAATIGALTPIYKTPHSMGDTFWKEAVGTIADGVLLASSAVVVGNATRLFFAEGSLTAALASMAGQGGYIWAATGALIASIAYKALAWGSVYKARRTVRQTTKIKAGEATTSGSGTVS